MPIPFCAHDVHLGNGTVRPFGYFPKENQFKKNRPNNPLIRLVDHHSSARRITEKLQLRKVILDEN